VSIIRYYGGNISFEYLRDASGTDIKGTTLLGLWQAAHKIGFDADGCEADIMALHEHNEPAILHVELPSGLQHYVVFYGEKKGKAIIGDPAKGIDLMEYEILDRLWISKKCLTLRPNAEFVKRKTHSKEKIYCVSQLIAADFPVLFSSSFMGIIISVLGLSTAIFNQQLIDSILPQQNFFKLNIGIWLLCSLLVIQVMIRFLRSLILITQQRSFQNRIIKSFFEKLLDLPKSFFDTRKRGDLLARLNDTSRIQQFISQLFGTFVIEFMLLATSIIFLTIYNIESGLITLIALPIFIFFMFSQNSKIIKAQQEVMIDYAESESNYIDTFSGIEVIQNHNLQYTFSDRHLKIYQKFQESIFSLGKIKLKIHLITGIIGAVYLVCIILNASGKVIYGDLTLGQLMAIFTASAGIIPLTTDLSILLVRFREAEIAFTRMQELMSYQQKRTGGDVILLNFNQLTIEDLSFRYPGRPLLLKNINLKIELGKITALLGENGCGKSTLSSLIQSFYYPEEGKIKINGYDLRIINQNEWKQKLGIVPQKIHIFNHSIYFNITTEEPSRKGMEYFDSFVNKLNIKWFFDQFPNSTLTLVGENGLSLSGGQQQFIVFLRAIYHNPQLLILDEATSAMDSETEKVVFGILNRLKETAGILFITHRIYVLKQLADQIYIFENKTIKHSGNHKGLMQTTNFYSRFWNGLETAQDAI
jgi:ATP-binding cassette subfamily B protein